jgi:hypothetical protein
MRPFELACAGEAEARVRIPATAAAARLHAQAVFFEPAGSGGPVAVFSDPLTLELAGPARED